MSSRSPSAENTDRPDTGIYARWWLSELRLQRFKAAFQPMPVRLMPFTVITGRNGSGKSTIFEALQWIDAALRRDIREASERYYGVHDLINLRQRHTHRFFELDLRWSPWDAGPSSLSYQLRIEQTGSGIPTVASERLVHEGRQEEPLIWTEPDRVRSILRRDVPVTAGKARPSIPIDRSDELALRYSRHELRDLEFVEEFWSRAVFLRLHPNRIAQGSPARHRSYEPLLDEEGHTLPALLNELRVEQLNEVVAQLADLFPGIEGILVSHSALGRDTPVYYNLHERIELPSGGHLSPVPIPAWTLSDGIRRLTAILALLVHDTPPSILCIEEIENSLDPWNVRALLAILRAAAERGTQVILTTHSPWILDEVPMDSILLARRTQGDLAFEHFASLPAIQAHDSAVPASVRYLQEGR